MFRLASIAFTVTSGGSNTGARARTRRAIIESATAVLSRTPDASLGTIARAAGVGRTTVHRHFPDRDALVRAIADAAMDATRDAYAAARLDEGPPIDALARLVHELVALGDRFAFLLREPALVGDPAVDAAEREMAAPIVVLIERGRASGALRDDLPVTWVLEVLMAAVYAAWGAIARGVLARADAPAAVTRTVLDGISAVRARPGPHAPGPAPATGRG